MGLVIVLLFALLGCVAATSPLLRPPTTFVRLGKTNPALALARLNRTASPLGPVGCQVCVDFFDVDLNTLLNAILQVGILGTCEDVCSKLPNSLEQVICTLLCADEGLKEFINILSQDDLDPIHLCADLRACKRNTCSGPCTRILSASASPASAKLRTKFTLSATVRANNNTGVGVTAFSFPANTESGSEGGEVVIDGLNAGQTTTVFLDVHTAEDEWIYTIGTNPVEVFSCGEDCTNQHGTIFTTAYTNFTITQ